MNFNLIATLTEERKGKKNQLILGKANCLLVFFVYPVTWV